SAGTGPRRRGTPTRASPGVPGSGAGHEPVGGRRVAAGPGGAGLDAEIVAAAQAQLVGAHEERVGEGGAAQRESGIRGSHKDAGVTVENRHRMMIGVEGAEGIAGVMKRGTGAGGTAVGGGRVLE